MNSAVKNILACFTLGIVLINISPSYAEDSQSGSSATKLKVNLFYGTVLNRFSHRPAPSTAPPVPGAEEESTSIDENYSVVGLQYSYELSTSTVIRPEIYGNFHHGNRLGETGEIGTVSGTTDAILSSQTIEAHVGLKILFPSLINPNGSTRADRPVLYLSGSLGFISPEDGRGDLIDDHRVSVGLELRSGVFQDTFISFGYGRTDVFEKSHERAKMSAGLAYRFMSTTKDKNNQTITKPSPHSLMFLALVDSDFGPGSDDFRMIFGYRFGLSTVFGQ